jgi:3'-phosphoadenosine 5'-phosphosulfate sulfotransferase (PAPS reductase)/FAD synthetase
VTPEAFVEKLQEIIEDLTRKGRQRPLFFACIAADGCTMTGSYGIDRRVVVTHPAQEELPLPINILFVDTSAKAQHVAISHANGIEEATGSPHVLC